MSTQVVWVFEPGMFSDTRAVYDEAIRSLGYTVEELDPDWWENGAWPRHNGDAVVFRGSLGDADRVRSELPWTPGAFCHTAAFACSSWYPDAHAWLANARWVLTRVDELVNHPEEVLAGIGSPERFFVRPDSPLKPFSGRVLRRTELSLEALDHGYYYDNTDLPVIVSPAQDIGREWRYVVAGDSVVAGSGYDPDGRTACPLDPGGDPWQFAAAVAAGISPPESVYALDVCEVRGELRLLELNPFSGADLYACHAPAVVEAVSRVALAMARPA